MTAESGLLLPSLDDLMAEAGTRSGVLAVLDALADIDEKLAAVDWERRSEELVTYHAQCPCGSVVEIRGELDTEDYDAIRDWDDAHADCEAAS